MSTHSGTTREIGKPYRNSGIPGAVSEDEMRREVSPGIRGFSSELLRKELSRFAKEELRDELATVSGNFRSDLESILATFTANQLARPASKSFRDYARPVSHRQPRGRDDLFLDLVKPSAFNDPYSFSAAPEPEISSRCQSPVGVRPCNRRARTIDSFWESEISEKRPGHDQRNNHAVDQVTPFASPNTTSRMQSSPDGKVTTFVSSATIVTKTGGPDGLWESEDQDRRHKVTTFASSATVRTCSKGTSATHETERERNSVIQLWKAQSRKSTSAKRKSVRAAQLVNHMFKEEENGNKVWKKLMLAMMILQETWEMIVSLSIIVNAIFIGIQTDYQARNVTEQVPAGFKTVEIVFCFVFTFELLVKLGTYKLKWFYMEGWGWNYFDALLVIAQLLEVIGMFTAGHESGPGTNLSLLRLLRVLRLFRILRLVRLMKFIGDLNALVVSIVGSLRSLMWTLFLLLLMIYIVSVIVTQMVHNKRLETVEQGLEVSDSLLHWWSSLGRSALSLYESILGGADWDELVHPLMEEVNAFMGPGFMVYIAFALLAMMNVITGIFVENALKNADKEKDVDFVEICRHFFNIPENNLGAARKMEISWNIFLERMADPAFQGYMSNVGIETKDAKLLFRLMDRDHSGSLDFDELVNGLVRLRAGAKFLDIAILIDEVASLSDGLASLASAVQTGDPTSKTSSSPGSPHFSVQHLRSVVVDDDL